MLGIAPLAAPWLYATGNALLAQNLALLLTLALAGWATYLLVRDLVGREDAAILSGVIYAFNTYNLHEVPRLQLLSAQWLPLALLYLHRAMTVRRETKRRALRDLLYLAGARDDLLPLLLRA